VRAIACQKIGICSYFAGSGHGEYPGSRCRVGVACREIIPGAADTKGEFVAAATVHALVGRETVKIDRRVIGDEVVGFGLGE